jgi:hypothetical protein
MVRRGPIQQRLRDGLALHQSLLAADLNFGEEERPFGGDLSPDLGERVLLGVLLKQEQEIADLDVVPLHEAALRDEPIDAGAEIDRIDRLDTPVEGHRAVSAVTGWRSR